MGGRKWRENFVFEKKILKKIKLNTYINILVTMSLNMLISSKKIKRKRSKKK